MTVAQEVIVQSIKDYVKQYGLTISIDEHRPTRVEGSKEERIAAALEHLYDDHRVWHFEGGYIPVLEDELIQARPSHDDIKDAMANAVSIAVKPVSSRVNAAEFLGTNQSRGRFGGVAFR